MKEDALSWHRTFSILWTFPKQIHVDEDKLPGVEEAWAAGRHHELPEQCGHEQSKTEDQIYLVFKNSKSKKVWIFRDHTVPDDIGWGAHRDNAGPGGRLPQQTLEHGGVGRLLVEGDVGDVLILNATHVSAVSIY